MQKIFIPNLEIPVVENCNLNCDLCNSHAYLIGDSVYPFDQFARDVDFLSQCVEVGMVTYMGGEPLLCPSLYEYISYAKQKRFGSIHRLLTNGILLRTTPSEVFRQIDVVEVSLYPEVSVGKSELSKFLHDLSREYSFSYYIKDIRYFNRIDSLGLNPARAQEGYELCKLNRNSCCMFNGMFYKCMRPKTTNLFLESNHHYLANDLKKTDGIVIDNVGLTDRINNYLSNPIMLESCQYCLMGISYKRFFSFSTIQIQCAKHFSFFMKWVYKHNSVYNACKRIKKSLVFDEGANSYSSMTFLHNKHNKQ